MPIKDFKDILQKEAKRVDIKDRKIFERGKMPAFFGRGMTDTIEFILYDNGDNQLPQGDEGKLVRYINISEVDNIRNYLLIARGRTSNKLPEYFVDVEKLINEAGYKNGLFRTQITLLNKRIGSEHTGNKLWIHEISPSRTEIRVLPIKADDRRIRRDLRDRYKIFLQNGEFKDDVLNRLDGFIDSIDADKVLKKILALYGQDFINQVKREFKIQDFDKFINDVADKSKEAIGYYISNREYRIDNANYGKPLIDDLQAPKGDRKRRNKRGRRRKTNSQRLDIKTLVNKTNEIICDTLRKLLPKRNLQVDNIPTLTKLESRDRIQSIVQKFGTSRKIDTKFTRNVKVVKPIKVAPKRVTIGASPKVKEKDAPDKPVKVQGGSTKYYFYHVRALSRGGIFRKRLRGAIIKYKNMDGEAVSFNLPSGKSTTVCAEEGTVKTSGSKCFVTKKAFCAEDTPVPKFVFPKRRILRRPNPVVKDLPPNPLPDIKLKFPIPTLGDDIKEQIRKNIEKTFPPIKFNFPFNNLGKLTPPRIPVRPNIKPVVFNRPRIDLAALSRVRLGGTAGPRTSPRRPLPSRPAPRRSGGGGGFSPAQTDMVGGFGSGRIQNRFTPGNTFTGYRRGGY